MPITVAAVVSYPVKGLGGVAHAAAQVGAGGLAHDRRFGIAFDAPQALLAGDAPWRPWNFFVSLKKHALAAHLRAEVEEVAGSDEKIILHIHHQDGRSVCGNPHCSKERRRLEAFLEDALECAPLTLVDSRAKPLWDDALPLTLLNAASLDALSAASNIPLQVERFRPNLLLTGAAPWAEDAWSGGTARIGNCHLRLGEGVPRCAATTVHPQTAQRDCRPPQLLVKLRGNADLGIFAQPQAGGGMVTCGEEVHLEPPA